MKNKEIVDHVRQGYFKELEPVREYIVEDLIDSILPWFLFGACCVALGYAWHYFSVTP